MNNVQLICWVALIVVGVFLGMWLLAAVLDAIGGAIFRWRTRRPRW